MKLAFALSGKRPAGDALEVARLVESRGLDEVWVTEDYCERGAFALAGAILTGTSRIRVGIGVVNPWTRHAMLTAMEAGALQEVGPGRVVLGLGASNGRWMQDQLGIPFVKPLQRLRESVEIIRAALAGKQIHHEGLAGTVDTRLAFAPGRLPIILGVKGPKALALAGEIADGILLSVLSSPAYVRWARQQAGQSAGLDMASYVAVDVHQERHVARERVRPFVAAFLGMHGPHVMTRLAGIEPALAEQFRNGWRSGNVRVDLVTDEILDAVVIAGDRDDLTAGLHRYAATGLGTAIIHDQLADDPGHLLDEACTAAQDA